MSCTVLGWGGTPSTPSYSSDYTTPTGRNVLEYCNAIRLDRSLEPLSTHKGLCKAAEIHAAKMADQLVPFSHENALSRINDAGTFEGCGENLARLENYVLEHVPEAAVEGWVQSPGHFRNMIMPDFNVCGVGLATHFKQDGPPGREEGDITAADPIVSRESVTYVTMLFGIEHADPKSKKGKIVEKMDATIMISAAAGAAIGGAVTGGMLGMAAGSMLHKAVGITPKGTAFCIKEFTKRELLGMGRLLCEGCEKEQRKKTAKFECDDELFCADCWETRGKVNVGGGDDESEQPFVVL